MKLKAVATHSLPDALLLALDSTEVADAFIRIVTEHLHVAPGSAGPATHYVQKTDYAIPTSDGRMGVEVTLSKVSVNDNRARNDFKRALEALQKFYIGLIEHHLDANQEAQLFILLALDQPIKFVGQEPTSLLELDPVMVSGRAD